ncbi:MAG: response regulator [Myxococcota bacterium]
MTRRYLLVDDNAAFVENLAEILQDTGATVDVAADAEAALEQLERARYDVLVTDMKMPGMSGTELLHRARRADPALPVVLLSAYVQDGQLSDARREGLLAVLSKPGKVPQLVGVLEKARRGGMVLLVEDDAALAENLSDALSARGLTVCTASTASELEQVDVQPFAALVDLRLPGCPTGEPLARVRERFPGTPTVVITGVTDASVPADAELYKKPFDTRALVDRLEQLFARVGAAP